MLLKRVLAITLAYLALGTMTTALLYLVTGVAQFGVDVFDERDMSGIPQLGIAMESLIGQKLALVPDIAIGFLFSRFLVALLEAVALTWCINRALPAYLVNTVGVGLPVVSEFVGAYPFAHNWVGMSVAVIATWPLVPEHVMPVGLVFRTAIAYLAPALLTGLAVSSWVTLRLRRQTRDSADES